MGCMHGRTPFRPDTFRSLVTTHQHNAVTYTTSLGEELFSIILYHSFTDTMLTHLLNRSTNKFTAYLLDILRRHNFRNLLR